MSWIEIIDEHSARGRLAEVYERIAGDRGRVANIMRVHSLNPEAMNAHLDLYLAAMFRRSGLSREDREIIATVVSVANRCPYCIHHHAEALRAYWKDDARVKTLIADPTGHEVLDVRQRAMVGYALALTRQPDSIRESSITALRETGLDDEAILALNLVIGYFNFVNRIALGLGVEFSAEEVGGYRY